MKRATLWILLLAWSAGVIAILVHAPTCRDRGWWALDRTITAVMWPFLATGRLGAMAVGVDVPPLSCKNGSLKLAQRY